MKLWLASLAFFLAAAAALAEPPKFPVATTEIAWSKLPTKSKQPPALPGWARMLAGPLPKTTAKMLELDHLHREKNPLGAALAAKIRWVAADVLNSPVGLATANLDLARAGVIPAGGKFTRPAKEPEDEAAALDLARKLTRAAYTVTDNEFADVLRHFGPEKTTAIAHSAAYANFYNRILLGLSVPADESPLPPVAIEYDAEIMAVPPARPSWDDLKTSTGEGPAVRVEWTRGGFDEMSRNLEQQKARKLRIPLAEPAKFEGLTPREKEMAGKVLWNTVSYGYQPVMTRTWFACLYAFYDEAKVDRVFTNSMFWVVTRTNDCFY